MSRTRIPAPARPRVSVVMVTYNAWTWTDRAIGALLAGTDPVYELVIVDNNSQDATVDQLGQLDGARILRNPVNHGFGPAANQGAAAARAPRVVFLNSDALVQPGWLEPLSAVLDAEPDVGAVAPRMLNLDGSLQEAGSILWRDGLVVNYGDTGDPGGAEFGFRRDVDYASAACLMVRRRDFAAVGGFDPVYAPAYFEDVDLCQALWERGMRTVYQPASTVVHARWASTDRSRATALIERNLPLFRDRWRDLLGRRPRRPARLDPRSLLLGRDAPCEDRVLVLADRVPGPDGTSRVDCLARDLVRLSPATRVTLFAADATGAAAAAARLLEAGVEVAWSDPGPEAWLDRRQLHYDAVLACGTAAAGELGAAVRRSQPTAAWAWDVTTAGPEVAPGCTVVLGSGGGDPGVMVPDPPGTDRERGLRAAMAGVGVALLPGRA